MREREVQNHSGSEGESERVGEERNSRRRVREANGFANKQASTALLQIATELKYTGKRH